MPTPSTSIPNCQPVLVNQLTELRIMSKAWAEKNKSVEPRTSRPGRRTFAHRNALGTGPTSSSSGRPTSAWCWSPTHWWGKGKYPHQPDRDRLHPIKADATHHAALLSGEIDFVIDPSLQDLARIKRTPNLQVLEGPEYRTIFLA